MVYNEVQEEQGHPGHRPLFLTVEYPDGSKFKAGHGDDIEKLPTSLANLTLLDRTVGLMSHDASLKIGCTAQS